MHKSASCFYWSQQEFFLRLFWKWVHVFCWLWSVSACCHVFFFLVSVSILIDHSVKRSLRCSESGPSLIQAWIQTHDWLPTLSTHSCNLTMTQGRCLCVCVLQDKLMDTKLSKSPAGSHRSAQPCDPLSTTSNNKYTHTCCRQTCKHKIRNRAHIIRGHCAAPLLQSSSPTLLLFDNEGADFN